MRPPHLKELESRLLLHGMTLAMPLLPGAEGGIARLVVHPIPAIDYAGVFGRGEPAGLPTGGPAWANVPLAGPGQLHDQGPIDVGSAMLGPGAFGAPIEIEIIVPGASVFEVGWMSIQSVPFLGSTPVTGSRTNITIAPGAGPALPAPHEGIDHVDVGRIPAATLAPVIARLPAEGSQTPTAATLSNAAAPPQQPRFVPTAPPTTRVGPAILPPSLPTPALVRVSQPQPTQPTPGLSAAPVRTPVPATSVTAPIPADEQAAPPIDPPAPQLAGVLDQLLGLDLSAVATGMQQLLDDVGQLGQGSARHENRYGLYSWIAASVAVVAACEIARRQLRRWATAPVLSTRLPPDEPLVG